MTTYHQQKDIISMSASVLSPQQNAVFNAYLRGDNILLSGQAGSGKSHIIKKIVAHAREMNKKWAVCAMTGCAAVLLECGATTLHSFAGVGLASGQHHIVVAQTMRKKHAVQKWRSIKLLIVDEVSAMSQKLFDIVEEVARRATGRSAPFGAIQVIFVGDFHQLPPIAAANDATSGAFCFESDRWFDVFPRQAHFDLQQVYRQTDPGYKRILSQVRKGVLDQDGVRALAARVGLTPDTVATRILPLRASVDFINRREYAKIDSPEVVFEYTTTFIDWTTTPISAVDRQKCEALTAEERNAEWESIIISARFAKTLRLKIGCAVMCISNIDMDRDICNGAQGTVESFSLGTRYPVVRFRNGVVAEIAPQMYPSEEFPCLSAGQIPLIHAWAVTVHKCQGIGLDCAEIDIGRSIFEYNQTYVALSRVRTLEGLYLTSFDPSKIRTQAKVLEFYREFPEPPCEDADTATVSAIDLDFEAFAYTNTALSVERDPDVKVIRL